MNKQELTNNERRRCVDLFKWHSDNRRTVYRHDLRVITAEQLQNTKCMLNAHVYVGKMWCSTCRYEARLQQKALSESFLPDNEGDLTNHQHIANTSNATFVDEAHLDCSIHSLLQVLQPGRPFEPTRVPATCRNAYRAAQLRKVVNILDPTDQGKTTETPCECGKSVALDWVLKQLVVRYATAQFSERRAILMLVPPNQFTYDEVCSMFGCSREFYAAACELRNSNQVAPALEARPRRLSPDVVAAVFCTSTA